MARMPKFWSFFTQRNWVVASEILCWASLARCLFSCPRTRNFKEFLAIIPKASPLAQVAQNGQEVWRKFPGSLVTPKRWFHECQSLLRGQSNGWKDTKLKQCVCYRSKCEMYLCLLRRFPNSRGHPRINIYDLDDHVIHDLVLKHLKQTCCLLVIPHFKKPTPTNGIINELGDLPSPELFQ